MALLGIDDEGARSFGQFAVGHDVDALVADQPEAGLLALAGAGAVIGIAKAAIGGSIGNVAIDDLADGENGKCKYRSHLTPLRGREGAANAPAAWQRSPRR